MGSGCEGERGELLFDGWDDSVEGGFRGDLDAPAISSA